MCAGGDGILFHSKRQTQPPPERASHVSANMPARIRSRHSQYLAMTVARLRARGECGDCRECEFEFSRKLSLLHSRRLKFDVCRLGCARCDDGFRRACLATSTRICAGRSRCTLRVVHRALHVPLRLQLTPSASPWKTNRSPSTTELVSPPVKG